MITPVLAYTRRFYKEREDCCSAVAESSDEADLTIAEDQHICIREG